MTRTGFAATVVGALAAVALLPAATITSAGAEGTTSHDTPLAAAQQLAGHHWHYRAQVDGRGHKDKITITAQPGFTLQDGFGQGQVLMHVDFAGDHGFAEAAQDLSYYSARTPWTPWLGATNLDRRGGKEIVLGFSTGAHSQLFTAYSYRSNGELLTFRAPRGDDSWFVNSSYGTGTSGWKCTRRGVQARSVSASGGPTAKVRLFSYAMGRNNNWHRTKRSVHTVTVDADGNPPAYTGKFARFTCAGLPKRVF